MSISLETARKLKEAGLKWEPQEGDAYITEDTIFGYEIYKGEAIDKDKCAQRPRLDQMLAEIEKLGYEWELGILTLNDGRTYMIDVALEELIKTESEEWKSFVANSPEEATAQVLLWILEQEDRT